jgi:succinylarginine dihydrolase
VLLVQQQARAIDAGAFHNDVVLVNAGERLLLHEYALVEQERILSSLRQSLPTLRIFQVAQRDLSLRQAVKSYLFNSQLLHSSQGYVLLAPLQSSQGPAARIIRRLVEEGFVDHVVFQDLEQSMAGGGGPACLRLRLPLTAQEMASIPPGILLNTTTLQRLQAWVTRYYRDALHPADLADPQLLQEAYEALDALTQLLALGAFYPFQRGASSASKGNI